MSLSLQMPGAASLWTSPPRSPPHRSLVANLAAANCYKKDHFDSPAIQEVVSKVEYIYITVRHPCHHEASGWAQLSSG